MVGRAGWAVILALVLLFAGTARTQASTAEADKALWEASSQGDANAIRTLLAKGANPNAMGRSTNEKEDYPAIFAAATRGHWESVFLLLDSGVAVNKTFSNVSLLMLAVRERNKNILLDLFKRGADPNVVGSNVETALHIAPSSFDPDIIEMLMRNGADPNKEDGHGYTPLFMCIFSDLKLNTFDCVQVLARGGADTNHKIRDGSTPLMAAASMGNLEGVKALIKLGADIRARDNAGLSAIDYVFGKSDNKNVDVRKTISDVINVALANKPSEQGTLTRDNNVDNISGLVTFHVKRCNKEKCQNCIENIVVSTVPRSVNIQDNDILKNVFLRGINFAKKMCGYHHDQIGVCLNLEGLHNTGTTSCHVWGLFDATKESRTLNYINNLKPLLDAESQQNAAIRAREMQEKERDLQKKQRFDALVQFFRSHNVEEFVPVDKLVANPFPYKGKNIVSFAKARRMIGETDVIFSQENQFILFYNPFIVSGFPADQFKPDEEFCVVGRVLGLRAPSTPIEGGMPITHIQYVGIFSGYGRDEIQAALTQARQ